MIYIGISIWQLFRRRALSVMAGDDMEPLYADDLTYLEEYDGPA